MRIASTLALAVLSLGICLPAVAQPGRGEQERGGATWKRKNEVDKLTQQRLDKTIQFYVDEDFEAADKMLDRLRVRSLNSEERKRYYAWRGYIASALGDLNGARKNLVLATEQTAASHGDLEVYLFQLAQFCMQQSDWESAVDYFTRWFGIAKEPNSGAYYLLALANWQLKDLDAALPPAIEAVEQAEEPQEGWLQLLLAVRLTRKEYAEAIPIYDDLIRSFPKKTYWVQLSTLHGALGNYEDSLVPMQLAYTQDLLDQDSEYRKLAQLLLFLELPIRAVEVMEAGLDNDIIVVDSEFYELLSNSWIMAREYDQAVEPLTRAAELSENGGIYLRLAEVHIQRERWEEATEALTLALDKGDLPAHGQAELLMGISYYSRKLPGKAMKWFGRATNFPDTKAEASTWLKHIEREQKQASEA